jgi:2,3-bisphosphoglycerate-independent phosphoglycerate mutase
MKNRQHFLFFFIDGLGIGLNNPAVNPLARADMPTLQRLLSGYRLVDKVAPYHNMQASLLSLDANLGVKGVPQSATGQAVLLTGHNIPAQIGYHFGPWPNESVAKYLENGNLFSNLTKAGIQATFLNAYPQRYFDSIDSGKRLYSSIPLAVTSAGIPLKTTADLKAGQALSADFTAVGWREHLGETDVPILTPQKAGEQMAYLAQNSEFSFFEYWLSDYAGHGQDMGEACNLLNTMDQVLDGLLRHWDYQNGLLLITSDHGNMEDLSTRRHTTNPVPALLVGAPALRRNFIHELTDLTGITPNILRFFGIMQ